MGRDVNELAESSGLPSRTTRFAVKWLIEAGLIERRVRLDDARRAVFRIAEPAPDAVPDGISLPAPVPAEVYT